MSTFDPKKLHRYRCGEEPHGVFALPNKLGWLGVVSVTKSGECLKHYRDGRLYQSMESTYDLINAPEKRTISVWAVINAEGDVIMVSKEKPCDPMFAVTGRQVVELTKEVEL